MKQALSRIAAISTNTFKEAIRNRAFIGLMLGALAMVLASIILSQMVVFDQKTRVLIDFGLFFISFAGVVISIVIGTVLVFKELERKTIYSILSKPVHRFEYIAGKYVGMFLILLVTVAGLTAVWLGVLLVRDVPLRIEFIKASILILGELSIVSAIAVLFSSFSSPILSGVLTFGMFVLGRVVNSVETMLLASKGLFVSNPALRPLGRLVTSVFPDLSLFDIDRQILLEVDVPWLFVAQSMGYAFCYVFIFVTLAALIFQRRDFV